MAIMTVQDCVNSALQLLNQYSIAGQITPLSYNDQSDDIARMVNLINDAQMEIATTNKTIDTSYDYIMPPYDPTAPIVDVEITMPSDYFKFKALRFTPTEGRDRQSRYVGRNFKWISEDTLVLPSKPDGTYTIEYCRYPVRLDPYMTTEARATTNLDNTQDTHEIIPYFVAAMIAIDENPKLYYALYNIWETRLARIGIKQAYAVSAPTEDVYGFGGCY